MTIYCDYHPKERAHWFCPECDKDYCSSCIITRAVEVYGVKKIHRLCPHCNKELTPHSAENIIIPFWRILHRFFIYPFKPQPLMIMLTLSFAFTFFNGCGLISALINLAIWGVLLKYAFAVLKETAKGSMRPPKITKENISDNFGIVFKQLIIYLAVGFVFILFARGGGIILAIIFLLFSALSLPAVIIVLVSTESLIAAINPMIFVPMIRRIGWGYLLMYLFYILLGTAPNTLTRFVLIYLPPQLHLFLLFFIKSYYLIISYHLMGYVLYQYHEEIGYNVEIEEQSYLQESFREMDGNEEILQRANILLKEGKIKEAIEMIRRETKEEIQDIQLAELYYNLLKTANATEDMVRYGKKYLELLSRYSERNKMVNVYLECVSKANEFPLGASVAFKLAKALQDAGYYSEAVSAYSRFIKSTSNHNLIPKAYYLAAEIIDKRLGNKKKALSILNALIKKYPDHEIIPYVKSYVKRLTLS